MLGSILLEIAKATGQMPTHKNILMTSLVCWKIEEVQSMSQLLSRYHGDQYNCKELTKSRCPVVRRSLRMPYASSMACKVRVEDKVELELISISIKQVQLS